MFDIILALHFNISIYIGTFSSMDSCIAYAEKAFPTVQYSCLHRSFINLPEDLKEIVMIEHSNNKFTQWESR